MSFTIDKILNRCCYDGCKQQPNKWDDYCDIHNIVVNIDDIIYYRNPYFQFKDLLNYKLINVLSKIKEELEDVNTDVDQHRNTIYVFNNILYKCTGLRMDRDILEDDYVFQTLNEHLINYAYETQLEGCFECEINLLVKDMELVDYIKRF